MISIDSPAFFHFDFVREKGSKAVDGIGAAAWALREMRTTLKLYDSES